MLRHHQNRWLRSLPKDPLMTPRRALKRERKNRGGQGSLPSNDTSGGKPKLTLVDFGKSLGTELHEVCTVKISVRAGAKDWACNSVCYRCQSKGHFARDGKNPMHSSIMCITGASYSCSGGGAHACECGSCHWTDGENIGNSTNFLLRTNSNVHCLRDLTLVSMTVKGEVSRSEHLSLQYSLSSTDVKEMGDISCYLSRWTGVMIPALWITWE